MKAKVFVLFLMMFFEAFNLNAAGINLKAKKTKETKVEAIYIEKISVTAPDGNGEEHELEAFIGETLAIIEAVRDGFGEIYANLLEWHYIDGQKWTQISNARGINRTYCYQLVDIAFDWIDSVSVSRLLKGEMDV